jgi:hypothetical protein
MPTEIPLSLSLGYALHTIEEGDFFRELLKIIWLTRMEKIKNMMKIHVVIYAFTA